MQQLGAVEAEVPLHREVAVVARCLAAPLGRLEWTGGLRRGRGFFRRRATHFCVWRASAPGPFIKLINLLLVSLVSSFKVNQISRKKNILISLVLQSANDYETHVHIQFIKNSLILFQVTDKGELEGEEDAFRDFSDIARNNQARINSEAIVSTGLCRKTKKHKHSRKNI